MALRARPSRLPHGRAAARAALTLLALVPLFGGALALALFALLGALVPARAFATIHTAGVLDGPANDILEVDGAALAPDGTGGVLYRKEVGGVLHLFAVPFAEGHFSAPLQVDTEDPYGASQPAIAAGDGGRLLVVWVQPRNQSPSGVSEYELMSASLQPGAGAFGQAIAVDSSVGERFTGDVGAVSPRLAMAPDGIAYVVYRVIANDCGPLDQEFNPACLPGEKLVEVRVARFDYHFWSSLGPVNRVASIAMRAPSAADAPAIAIDEKNNGIVAWQEPDASGTARIWVRRLFGAAPGTVLQASPASLEGRPVATDAEAPAIGEGPLGEARIAFLLKGTPGSPQPTTQLYESSLPRESDPSASQLSAAQAVAGAQSAALGPPSAAADVSGDFRIAFNEGPAERLLTGGENAPESTRELGPGVGPASTTLNPAGGGTSAWVSESSTAQFVQAREDYAAGAYQTARLAGDLAGPVAGLTLAGSGEGDALLAWMQGAPGRSEVVGAFAQAPPQPFTITGPIGWVRGRYASVNWEASLDAAPGLTYDVYLDGRPFQDAGGATQVKLATAALGDGAHKLQVLALAADGQRTMSTTTPLKVDTNPPIVTLELIDHGRGARVSVRDRASGVDASATSIAFGDGKRVHGRTSASHRYRRAGRYTILARVRDQAGNHALVRLRVAVR